MLAMLPFPDLQDDLALQDFLASDSTLFVVLKIFGYRVVSPQTLLKRVVSPRTLVRRVVSPLTLVESSVERAAYLRL